MNHDICKLFWRKVIIISNRDTEVIKISAKPPLFVVAMEVATRPKGVQQVKYGNRQLPIKVFHIALIEGYCNIHCVCNHIQSPSLVATARPHIANDRSIIIPPTI